MSAPENPAGAALVLDEKLLAEFLAQLGSDNACHHIRGAAGRERHHDAHRPVRIGTGPHRLDRMTAKDARQYQPDQRSCRHVRPLP
jgi:hypothetical protein